MKTRMKMKRMKRMSMKERGLRMKRRMKMKRRKANRAGQEASMSLARIVLHACQRLHTHATKMHIHAQKTQHAKSTNTEAHKSIFL
jgi:hypothetical protein